MNDGFDSDGMQIAEIIFNGSGFKVVGISRKGRPWTPSQSGLQKPAGGE